MSSADDFDASEDPFNSPGKYAPKLGPGQQRALARALAAGDVRRAALARQYGVTPAAITKFAKVHDAEIAAIRTHLDAEFAGLWIASKEARIAAHQADYEAALAHEKGDHHEWIKTRTAILHAVAEELGQLPPRQTVTVVPVTHVIVGVDTEALR